MKFCEDFQAVVSELTKEKMFMDIGYGTKLARSFVRVAKKDFEAVILQKASLQRGEFLNKALKMGFVRPSSNGGHIFITRGQQVCYISRGVIEVIIHSRGIRECWQ